MPRTLILTSALCCPLSLWGLSEPYFEPLGPATLCVCGFLCSYSFPQGRDGGFCTGRSWNKPKPNWFSHLFPLIGDTPFHQRKRDEVQHRRGCCVCGLGDPEEKCGTLGHGDFWGGVRRALCSKERETHILWNLSRVQDLASGKKMQNRDFSTPLGDSHYHKTKPWNGFWDQLSQGPPVIACLQQELKIMYSLSFNGTLTEDCYIFNILHVQL